MEFNEKPKSLQYALLAGGITTTMIGTAHIFMPTFGYADDIPKEMSKEVGNHFYYLGTYAICGFLLTLGGLSIYFSKLENMKNSLVVSLFLALLWSLRAILEVIYPVDIPIFMLKTPHIPLLSVIIFLAFSYSIGCIGGYKLYLTRQTDRETP
jgi:hypothetical protein